MKDIGINIGFGRSAADTNDLEDQSFGEGTMMSAFDNLADQFDLDDLQSDPSSDGMESSDSDEDAMFKGVNTAQFAHGGGQIPKRREKN